MPKQLGNNVPATIAELEVGAADNYALQLAKPVASGSIPTGEAAIGTAKKAIFQRVVIPCAGTLHDIAVANGSTVNGKHVVAVFDTGQAKAGKYSPLWQSAEVSASGASAWQVVADPALPVWAGQQLLFAVMNTGTTHTYGTTAAPLAAAVAALPTNYAPLGSGNSPKLTATHTFTEAKFVQIPEAELTAVSGNIVIVGRVA